MNGNGGGNPATHFGKQMRKERTARGWSIHEFARRSGINAGHVSRIETGKRPPTEHIAELCDTVFPERRGWFSEYYAELQSWAPPGFRDWPEYEDRAGTVHDWQPGIVTGMLQTPEYARALLRTLPGVADDAVTARLANRTQRQQRVVLRRDDPPLAVFLLDHVALYRRVGDAGVMADQMSHLVAVGARENVTLQVMPAIAHPATQSGFIVTDTAAYAEHVLGGYAYTDPETVTRLARLFDTLRGESYRVSESTALIREAGKLWTGERQASQARTVDSV